MTRIAAPIAIALLLMLTPASAWQGRQGRPPRPPVTVAEVGTLTKRIAADAGSASAPVLFTIGLHVEPFGATVSAVTGRTVPPDAGRAQTTKDGRSVGDYHNEAYFDLHAKAIRDVARLVERHDGRLTVQVQSPFTTTAAATGDRLFSDLEQKGHEIALHLHADAHMGPRPENVSVTGWTAVMNEELAIIAKAGAKRPVTYWSVGVMTSKVLEAASAAGLRVNSDFKIPATQETPRELLGTWPWRPSAGATSDDVSGFARHDPNGRIVFLPEGNYERTDLGSSSRAEAGGEYAFFDSLTTALERTLRSARPDRVNVFHFTIHAGEFRGAPGRPFDVIDQWLKNVLDPVLKSQKVRWSTLSAMGEAFVAWEQTHPGVDPRSGVR